ncbi:MAG: hypothetical protein L0Z62_20405 [Gemmataceae bacterium]|nr:hypothetical protein [Gemmataceae bacterium]
MSEQMTLTLAATVLGLLFSGCTSNTEPGTADAPKQGASVPLPRHGHVDTGAREERVTVYVEGMTKLQGIT